jgi:large subunit ribosomal protein L9
MKVVFLEDVPNVARAGDIKKVANGYARNYLFPKKLATLATSAELQKLELRSQAYARRQATEEQEAEAFARELADITVTLKARAGAKEKIYGSITTAAIAKELKRLTKRDIDKHSIQIDEPIKELGSHKVSIKLTRNVTATVSVLVEPKEEVEKVEKEAKQEKAQEPETGQDKGKEQEEIKE